MDFDEYLKAKWNGLYSSKDTRELFRSTLSSVQMRSLDKIFIAYFNQELIEKKRKAEIFDLDDEEFKENEAPAPSVFKDFNEKTFNFNNVNPKEILFHVNLDEETIIDNEKMEELDEENFLNEDKLEDEIEGNSVHPIITNISPICPLHSVIPLFPTEELPQVIGSDLIVLLLQLFKMSNNPNLKITYNSIGGYASVNHLHFQLLYGEQLFKNGLYPVETFKRKEIFRTSLQNPKEDINMYSVGVIFEEIPEYPVRTLVLSPANKEADIGDIFSSLSFVAGTVTERLLQNNVPHNILFSDKGNTVYIFPRKFETENANEDIRCATLEIAGIAICRNLACYKELTLEKFHEILREEVSLKIDQFNKLVDDVLTIFKSQYVQFLHKHFQ
eukprot:TRINITY_DN11462_c0_g1_i2.p1 TRINITY_DN11462_c0_g1~~TRINITY_DN11462_c0_g1_i2.p1  ORF type:complete len:387 (-),score=63.45 TRINITY_DN11462_c0_g1_i2:114-1274(-)